jgi:hypothetical protein
MTETELEPSGAATVRLPRHRHTTGASMSTFDTPEPISVTVELAAGDVRLVATDRVDTVVVVSPSNRSRKHDVDAAEQTLVEFSGGGLLVRTPRRRGLGSYLGAGRAGSVDVTIELPARSRLEGEAGFADFRGEGRLGDVRIKAGAGDIRFEQTAELHVTTGAGRVTVDHAAGPAEVTAAGDLRLGEIEGETDIKNLNGKTWVGEVAGALRVKSANGDITVGRAHAGVGAKTANGSIRVGEVARGSVVIETAAGGLEVGIRPGTVAWVDANSRFGRVHNTLGATGGPDPSEEAVEIRARTAYGDIVIHRA